MKKLFLLIIVTFISCCTFARRINVDGDKLWNCLAVVTDDNTVRFYMNVNEYYYVKLSNIDAAIQYMTDLRDEMRRISKDKNAERGSFKMNAINPTIYIKTPNPFYYHYTIYTGRVFDDKLESNDYYIKNTDDEVVVFCNNKYFEYKELRIWDWMAEQLVISFNKIKRGDY